MLVKAGLFRHFSKHSLPTAEKWWALYLARWCYVSLWRLRLSARLTLAQCLSWVIFSSETFLWATLIICQWWDVMHTVLSESSASLNRRTCSRCCSDWLDFITSVWTASSAWLYRHVTNSRESLQETEKTHRSVVCSQNLHKTCLCTVNVTCFVVFNSFIVNIEHYWLVNIHQFATYWSCFSSLHFILFIVSPLDHCEYKGSCCWGNRTNWDPAAVQTSWAQLSSNHDQMWLNWACWDSSILREIPEVFRLSKSRLFLPRPGENRPAFSLEGDQSCVFKHHLHGPPLLLDAGLDVLNNYQLI